MHLILKRSWRNIFHERNTKKISPFRKLNTFSLCTWKERKTEKMLSLLINLKHTVQKLCELETTLYYLFSLQVGLPLIGAVTTSANGRSRQNVKLKQIQLQWIQRWNACNMELYGIVICRQKRQISIGQNIKTYSFIVGVDPQRVHCLSARVLL